MRDTGPEGVPPQGGGDTGTLGERELDLDAVHGHRPSLGYEAPSPHPLVRICEGKLSRYIGFLSNFIAKKHFSRVMGEKGENPSREQLEDFFSGIKEEIRVLIGPGKADELIEEIRYEYEKDHGGDADNG